MQSRACQNNDTAFAALPLPLSTSHTPSTHSTARGLHVTRALATPPSLGLGRSVLQLQLTRKLHGRKLLGGNAEL